MHSDDATDCGRAPNGTGIQATLKQLKTPAGRRSQEPAPASKLRTSNKWTLMRVSRAGRAFSPFTSLNHALLLSLFSFIASYSMVKGGRDMAKKIKQTNAVSFGRRPSDTPSATPSAGPNSTLKVPSPQL